MGAPPTDQNGGSGMITIQATGLASLSPQNAKSARGLQQKAITTAAAPALNEKLAAAGIDTELRIAHFLAQTCEESDGYCTTEEYASGLAYEWRADLGNNQPGDGVKFKGRGLIMITGPCQLHQLWEAAWAALDQQTHARRGPGERGLHRNRLLD